MLGHRGDRLAVTYPEILEMQVRAIIEAACEVQERKRFPSCRKFMIPLAGTRRRSWTISRSSPMTPAAGAVFKEQGVKVRSIYTAR